MKKFILPFLFLCSVLFVHAQNGTIKGRVFNEKSNEPLPFTNIIIFGTNIGSTSDLDGNFIFTGVEPGFVKLAATSVGFEQYISEEFQVTNAKTSFVNVPMRETSIQLDQVVVKASPFRKTEESPVSMRTLGIGDIEKNPGANRDISKVIQALPGVASTVSFRNDIIVRGGGPSENRFYLDGMEIPNLNHFATQGASGGPVGIINVDFIREVDFYSGAFPANRGNALSSVLEMKQIDGNPERLIVKGAFGASDLALTLNGPLSDNTTFLFSARRSYLQFLFGLIGLPFLPTYNDFQFKVKTRFDQKNELTLLGIGAIDQFSLNTDLENPTEDQRYILNYLPVNEQWNYAIGAVYKHFRTNSFDTWVFSRNMLNNVAYKYVNNDENLPKTLDYSSQEIENKVRYEYSSRMGEYKIISGAGGEYAKYNTNTFQKVFIPSAEDTIRSIDYGSSFDMFKYHVFAQVSRNFMNDRLILSAGLRTDGNNYSENMSNLFNQLSPRFSSALAITDKFFFNFNTGRYYQQPAYTTLGFRDNAGRLVNKDNNLKYIASNHLVAGFEFRRTDATKLTLEGFYKTYGNYPVSVADSISLANKGGDFGIYGNEEVTSTGEGRAYGFEVYMRDKILDKFDIILSYTFVRSEFKDNLDKYVPSSWDNRHLLNLTLSREFKRNWNAGAKWRFVGGSPYTPWDLDRSSLIEAWDARRQGYLDYSQFNTQRIGNFHQLDVRVDKQYFFEKWSLNVYVDIQNLYNFKQDGAPNLITETDDFGNDLVDPLQSDRYLVKQIVSESGTVLPTIGIIVEF
ncbi:MAG: TonB-dependent receptor [Lentimicrobium sp.]|jgi:outer membrane receptor for ferrienterochelin and colicin|nr:TonB-dependent receptor [Lentimicrobium sp.]